MTRYSDPEPVREMTLLAQGVTLRQDRLYAWSSGHGFFESARPDLGEALFSDAEGEPFIVRLEALVGLEQVSEEEDFA